jgi:aspartyl-tRNA(Asn)/glutamyl-tRNA(Gln) amidotransferase subunit A
MQIDTCKLEIATASAAIAEGRLSPLDLTEACLQRISAENDQLCAFITVLPDSARHEAAAAAVRAKARRRLGPLDGIPLAVKDVLALAGAPTTAGSRVLADFVPEADCPAVAALRRAGAVIVGKTNMHEFAYGVTSNNPYYGAVLNPRWPDRTVGGSSGGSAAAVAAGMVLGAIGTDTGGSIRIPAAACGLWGLKPGYGLLPPEGVVPQAWSLDHLGPMGKSAEDLRLLLTPWLAGHEKPSRDPVLVVPTELLDSADSSTRVTFGRFVERIGPGASIHPVHLPDHAAAHAAWLTILLAESAAYHATTLRRTPELIGADVRPFLLAGSLIGADRYLAAQRFRADWLLRLDAALGGADAFLHPTLPGSPPLRGAEEMLINGTPAPVRDALVRFEWPANLSGWPALAFPAEPPDGAEPPFSLMLTGRPGSELALLDMAGSFAAPA